MTHTQPINTPGNPSDNGMDMTPPLPLEAKLAVLRARLGTLKTERDAGHLSQAVYDTARQSIEQDIVRVVMAENITVASAVAPLESSVPTRRSGVPVRKRVYLAAGLASLGIACAAYAWVGNPAAMQTSGVQAAQAATDNPHGNAAAGDGQGGMTFEQMRQRTDALAKRLEGNPGDLNGWSMLARSYAVLGQFKESAAAYQKAIALAPQDAQLLVDFADTLAMSNGRSLQGEPGKLIAKALKLEPSNIKALALAGTAAFERQDYAAAIQWWDKAVKLAQPGTDFERRLRDSLADARAAAGSDKSAAAPAVSKPAAPGQEPAGQPDRGAVASRPAVLKGTVSLNDALRGKAKDDDALFVFAVPVEGSRMPVAVLRAKVKDLPLDFELNDSLAMSPGNKLSDQKKVLLKARISRTGDAMPKVGDLEGESASVEVGSTQVKLHITRERS